MGYWEELANTFGGSVGLVKQPGALTRVKQVVAVLAGRPVWIEPRAVNNSQSVTLALRTPFDAAPAVVSEAISRAEALPHVLGKPAQPALKTLGRRLTIGQGWVRVDQPYTFRRPRPSTLRALAEALVAALDAPGLKLPAGCERCSGREEAPGLTSIDGVPWRIGAGCREQLNQQEREQEAAYLRLDPRQLPAILAGTAAASAGALLLGALEIGTGKIFLKLMVVLGCAVGAIMGKVAVRPTILTRFAATVLAIAGVLSSDLLACAWGVRERRPELDFLSAFRVSADFALRHPGEFALPIVLAGLGGLLAFAAVQRKKFVTRKDAIPV